MVIALLTFFVYRKKAVKRRESMSGMQIEEDAGSMPLRVVRGSVHGKKATVVEETTLDGGGNAQFPSQDEPSYFSRQSRAEVQVDSLFDPGSTTFDVATPANPAATLRKGAAGAAAEYLDVQLDNNL